MKIFIGLILQNNKKNLCLSDNNIEILRFYEKV